MSPSSPQFLEDECKIILKCLNFQSSRISVEEIVGDERSNTGQRSPWHCSVTEQLGSSVQRQETVWQSGASVWESSTNKTPGMEEFYCEHYPYCELLETCGDTCIITAVEKWNVEN